MQTGAYLLLTDMAIESQQDLLRFMEFAQKTRKPVVIIAPDFNSEALTSMVVNNLKGVAELVAIKTPIESEDMPILEDIACFSGGRVVSMGLGERVG